MPPVDHSPLEGTEEQDLLSVMVKQANSQEMKLYSISAVKGHVWFPWFAAVYRNEGYTLTC